MVTDFRFNHLTDQLAQNPLNLSSEDAIQKYHRPPRTNTRSFSYDPVPDPNGKEYSFDINFTNTDSIKFIRDVRTEFGKQITNSVFIIAHTNNNQNHFTSIESDAYDRILNNLDLEELEITNQQEDKKILLGLWRNLSGVDFLDVAALYTRIQSHVAEKLSDLYDQNAILKIYKNGKVKLI